MGILEEIKAAIEVLTTKVDAIAAGGPAAEVTDKPPTAAEKKAAAAAAKVKAAASAPSFDFTAEELRDKFVELQNAKGSAVAKKVIADLGFDKLAKLIGDMPNWQIYWDAVAEALAVDGDDADADDSGL